MKAVCRGLFISCCLSLMMFAHAHEYSNEQFFVDHPWARPTFSMATTGAVYLSLKNVDSKGYQLQGVSVPKAIAAEAQIHAVSIVDDMSKMIHLSQGVNVEPNDTVVFSPGGMHIMLLGLKNPLIEGESFPMTLHFDNANNLEVKVNIEAPKSEEKAPPELEHNH